VKNMKIIGLTGGIGSGKSTVSQFLAELGAVVIDADKTGHDMLSSNIEVHQELVAAFGQEIVDLDGGIDRKKLSEIVFNQPESLVRLNQIMHSRMYDVVKIQLEEYQRQGVAVVVLEAALLIEASWTSLVDEVWVTITPEEKIIERLSKNRGLAEKETKARIRSQLPSEERARHADVIINNEDDLDSIKANIRELWQKLERK